MRITKIKIRNLFGISECALDGKSVELVGPKGAGKSSALDAIRYALTNQSNRDYIIRSGEDEGEILIETDTGLSINRTARSTKAPAIKVKDGDILKPRPAEFLREIFTPLQLNPIEFTAMPRAEKNRVILSMIEFKWDIKWIEEQFGEIPPGVDYGKHILEVLSDIQAESGAYFTSRQNINRDVRNGLALIADIAKSIPKDYNANHWREYSLGNKYRALERIKHDNNQIERARALRAGYEDKRRSIDADAQIASVAEERAINAERTNLETLISRLEAEIVAAKEKVRALDGKLEDRMAVINAKRLESIAKLDNDMGSANELSDKELTDVTDLDAEVAHAEQMIKHLNEYARMEEKQREVELLRAKSDALTEKIEKARNLPGEILASAEIPIKGLTVKDGIPLINGLPISNLSDGEVLDLCVDVTIQRPGQLQIILVDGAERLDTESRERLYAKCKEKGLQLIATRVTDSDILDVVEL